MFREFTRLEEGAREAQGLGLGLSIVDRIARVLRLEIADHFRQGKGTRFSVILPVSDAAERRRHHNAGRALPAAVALTGLCVLCVDNDPRILEGMRLLLEGWGCNVRTAPARANSNIRAASAAPDIILADYHLDGENGLDVIRRLPRPYGARTCPQC